MATKKQLVKALSVLVSKSAEFVRTAMRAALLAAQRTKSLASQSDLVLAVAEAGSIGALAQESREAAQQAVSLDTGIAETLGRLHALPKLSRKERAGLDHSVAASREGVAKARAAADTTVAILARRDEIIAARRAGKRVPGTKADWFSGWDTGWFTTWNPLSLLLPSLEAMGGGNDDDGGGGAVESWATPLGGGAPPVHAAAAADSRVPMFESPTA